jgi:dihydroorotase
LSVDVIIKGGMVVSHQGIEQKDILIRDGIIVAMGDLTGAATKSEVDASGLHILPGVIETDIHLRDLLNSEFRASIRGGVT